MTSRRCDIPPDSPRALYAIAVRERRSPDAAMRREACEKAWLAVIKAVDKVLDEHNLPIDPADPKVFQKRRMSLAAMVDIDPAMGRLPGLYSEVADYLHGACFYDGTDNTYIERIFTTIVPEILDLTNTD